MAIETIPSGSKHRTAVVTLAIGSKYVDMFDKYCSIDWNRYCKRFSHDLIVIKEPLDMSERAKQRSPAWQKLLILSQDWSTKYDQIVWMDTDVMINNARAFDICQEVPKDKIGAVEAYSVPTRGIHRIALERQYQGWKQNDIKYLDNIDPCSYYTNRGIPGGDLNEVVQTGVFVCSPNYHREIFEHIYFDYEGKNGSEWNYEMPAMSYELVKANLVHWIQPQFNFTVTDIASAFYPELNLCYSNNSPVKGINKISKKLGYNQISKNDLRILKNIFDLSIFMHFAGCSDLMSNAIRDRKDAV